MNDKLLRSQALLMPVSQSGIAEFVKSAVSRRRASLVVHLAQEIYQRMEGSAVLHDPGATAVGGWTGVHSLSQLRAIVGGRFKNLKEKWTEAGFPIRAHRGDRLERAAIDPTGWTGLAQWISRQGFDARLPTEEEEFLFAVRRTGAAQ